MTSRLPLPLRLVQCDWRGADSRVLTLYKPSGLPCYAASQVRAVAASGGDGRHLSAVHTRHASPTSSTATASVAAGPQPRPEDPSDSLLSRVVDSSLPGATPYVALPVVSSLLRRTGAAAAQMNMWTSRHRGLVVVARSPSDAFVLRNAVQLDLVQVTYRVVCRLPGGVAVAARRYLRAHHHHHHTASSAGGVRAAAVQNPYVQAHLERRGQLADLADGIPLSSASVPSATAAAAAALARDARLPAGVQPHPLVTGGFFDVAQGRLRVQGTARCYLRTQTPLAPTSAARLLQRSRLQRIFSDAVGGSAAEAEEDRGEHRHPWIPPECRLGVSLDAPHMQCSTGSPAPRGKSLTMDFRLVSLSPREDSDVALYEVRTRGDTTADEVAAMFHAEGLRVVNDYVQDAPLAAVMEEVAARMRAAPPSMLHDMPVALQHQLRSATAEELVALPLAWMSLEDADRLSAQHTLQQLTSLPSALPFAEDVDRLRRVVHSASSSALTHGGSRNPVQQLLLHTLSSLNMASKAEHDVYARVLALALGAGVECVSLVFPDPSDAGNVHALQQLWLTYEQQRQRHPSLADAVRAARQHPLAASMRCTVRTLLDDAVGLARVPLLADAHGETPAGAAAAPPAAQRRRVADAAPSYRGECSFTQAAALLSAIASSQTTGAAADVTSSSAPALARVGACDTRAGHTEVPPPYEAAYHSWCADPAAVRLPSPAELLRRCGGDRGAAAAATTREAALSAPSPESPCSSVRLFLRVEELAELRCAHCGGVGHTWQHCVARVAESVAAVDGGTVDAAAALPTPGDVADTISAPPRSLPAPLEASVMDGEGLTSVDDAAALLGEQAAALARHRGGDGDDAALLAVPNVAATHRFAAAHALRTESRKPAVHRRVVRCVYCGGRHHVAACPALRARDAESDVRDGGAAAAVASAGGGSSGGPPPFCIKCGETGHLYTTCRAVPAGLHHATHCPICLQPRGTSSHEPARCPRRVPVPDGYSVRGVPHPAEAARVRGAAPARRRHGSVLIADSFVDSR
ncbi:hypothetical protein NESM_000529500 [Novymonas esmeraldas]|uniref:CCHC-type domain-containing protein n=1 Tax=Novymonas esmeraldas TaxID=1808958 RepID=A0AAW0ETC9_9TRYP